MSKRNKGLEDSIRTMMHEVEGIAKDVRASVRLIPHKDVLVAYEPGAEPPQGSSLLSNMTVRMHFVSALQADAGTGLHALLAARHTDRAVAVEADPQALALIRVGTGLALGGELARDRPLGRGSVDAEAHEVAEVAPGEQDEGHDEDRPEAAAADRQPSGAAHAATADVPDLAGIKPGIGSKRHRGRRLRRSLSLTRPASAGRLRPNTCVLRASRSARRPPR